MAPEDFAEHVQSLITKKSEKDRNCDRHCDRLMQELCSHTYLWNRKDLEVKALAEITQPELVEFFVKHLSVTSQTRRRIACHVVGRAALDVLKGAGVEPSGVCVCVCAFMCVCVCTCHIVGRTALDVLKGAAVESSGVCVCVYIYVCVYTHTCVCM